MIKGILSLLIFTILGNKIIAQPLGEISNYINSKDVSKNAKDYYNGLFKASDNLKTESIIDSLRTKNSNTRPFYLYLVSKMSTKSDGALSESLGMAFKDFTKKYPNELISFLYSENKLMDFLPV